MNRTRRNHPAVVPARIMRAGVARWLAVMLIVPMLVLGASSRAIFLAHCHDEHGVHLHPIMLLHGDALPPDGHASHYGHEHTTTAVELSLVQSCGSEELAALPCVLSFCYDVHKQLPARGLDVRGTLSASLVFSIAAFVLSGSADPGRHVRSPVGYTRDGPVELLAMSAGDRLVRTSRALLI